MGTATGTTMAGAAGTTMAGTTATGAGVAVTGAGAVGTGVGAVATGADATTKLGAARKSLNKTPRERGFAKTFCHDLMSEVDLRTHGSVHSAN